MYARLKLTEAGEKERHDIGEDISVGTSAGFKTPRKHEASQLVEVGKYGKENFGREVTAGQVVMYYLGCNRLVMIAVNRTDQTQGLTGQPGPTMTPAATAHHTLAKILEFRQQGARDQGLEPKG